MQLAILSSSVRRLAVVGVCAVALCAATTPSQAGSMFLTGHDPDFHAQLGGNALGAQHINQAAINFILNPAFNPYYLAGIHKFLYVQSRIAPPSGHTDGKIGLTMSGYVEGTDFEHHDASDLNAEINQLGFKYSGIVVASDFGGILTQAELGILNARRADIIAFVNNGGGLYAMTESNSGAGLTPLGGWFDFVPTTVISTQFNQSESGFTVTAFGASLGLTSGDVNGNASHNIFPSAPVGFDVVDIDASGNIMSVAGRSDQFVATKPSTWGRIKSIFR